MFLNSSFSTGKQKHSTAQQLQRRPPGGELGPDSALCACSPLVPRPGWHRAGSCDPPSCQRGPWSQKDWDTHRDAGRGRPPAPGSTPQPLAHVRTEGTEPSQPLAGPTACCAPLRASGRPRWRVKASALCPRTRRDCSIPWGSAALLSVAQTGRHAPLTEERECAAHPLCSARVRPGAGGFRAPPLQPPAGSSCAEAYKHTPPYHHFSET